MPKIYHLRLVGGDSINVPESEYRHIESDIMSKSDRMVRASGTAFSARDVKRVTSSFEVEVPNNWQEEHPEITDEMRSNNLRRMRWVRNYIFNKNRTDSSIPDDEKEGYKKFVSWYESDTQKARRAKKGEFRKEFFDVYFETHEETEASYQAWLTATIPEADPREYNRDKLTPVALGTREVTKATKIFDDKQQSA